MTTPETSLQPVETQAPAPVNLGTLQAFNAADMVEAASAVAKALAPVIEERRLYKELGQSKHVYIEGWTTLGAMLGVAAQELKVERLDEGRTYVAKVGLFRLSDGHMIASASAECGGDDEPDWILRPKYEWRDGPNGRERVLVGETPIPAYARRSMAITRAAGKAFRLAFSWIMELAGYSPTPAEEMSEDFGRGGGGKKAGSPPAADGTRQISAKYDGICQICGEPYSEGDPIAYRKGNGNGEKARVAHWSCYTADKNAPTNGGQS